MGSTSLPGRCSCDLHRGRRKEYIDERINENSFGFLHPVRQEKIGKMSMSKSVKAGIIGGLVGGALVGLAVSAGWIGGGHMRGHVFIPLTLQFAVDGGSTFKTYAYITSSGCCKKAKLVIPRFAVATGATPIKTATSVALDWNSLPVNVMPVAPPSEVKDAKFYIGDTSTFAHGKAKFDASSVTLALQGTDTAPAGKAWGLAHTLEFEYPISN